MKNKKKTILAISLVVALFVITLGITYAAFVYRENTNNQQLVLGEIYMYYNEVNELTIENALPGDEYSKYFEFTITGMNTYKEKDIYYEVILTRGSTPDDKLEANRLSDSSLLFKLVEVADDDTETVLLEDRSYSDLTSQRIYIATIEKDTTQEVNKRYRLYAKISNNITICGGEITEGCDYFTSGDTLNWTDAFGSIKVNVVGNFDEKVMTENFVNLIKSKYGTDTTLVAVNSEGTLYDGTGEIREYRYSGPTANNYVFFDTNGDGLKTDDEIWRIIGVFKDTVKDSSGNEILDNGNPIYEEKIKLMRNTVLASDEMPNNYTVNNLTYAIEDTENLGCAFWQEQFVYTRISVSASNEWSTAGLQYYLNTEQDESDTPNPGYLSLLSTKAKTMFSLTTYQLGVVDAYTDTALGVYEEETKEDMWTIKKTWNGYVGLLYPSDYRYSTSSEYWNTAITDAFSTLSWMNQITNHQSEWLISPGYSITRAVGTAPAMAWIETRLEGVGVDQCLNVRPTINLVSSANVLDAAGTLASPYTVVLS